jgi:phenylalanyl-tRNA synthetase alpha chain
VSDGYTITADVYRRDAIDRSHYPVFHQMEGARVWDRQNAKNSRLAELILNDVRHIPQHELMVEDNSPTAHSTNPLQSNHSMEEVEALAAHLKRSLEDVVVTIFSAARAVKQPRHNDEPLKIRWVEAYFPFTSPSWELEVFWQGEWLEVLGCGIVQQSILDTAKANNKIGWAFGLGLERIAMLLYDIPDIRLFWSTDQRFLSQFSKSTPAQRFMPFSKYPPCWKDISFWLPNIRPAEVNDAGAEASGGLQSCLVTGPAAFHENDMMELVREVAGDLVEDVHLVDEFEHPKSKRRSLCYRINYRSLERTLKNDEVNELHKKVGMALCEQMSCELR